MSNEHSMSMYVANFAIDVLPDTYSTFFDNP